MHHCPGDMGAPHDVMRAPPPLIFYFLDNNGGLIKRTEVDVVAWFNPNRAEVLHEVSDETRLMPSYGRSKLMPNGKRVGTSLTLPTQGHPHPLKSGNPRSTRVLRATGTIARCFNVQKQGS